MNRDSRKIKAGAPASRRIGLILAIASVVASGSMQAQPAEPSVNAAPLPPKAAGLNNLGSRQGGVAPSADMLKLAPQGDSERAFGLRPGVPDMEYQTNAVGGVAPLGGGVKLKAAVGASSSGGVVGVGVSVPW